MVATSISFFLYVARSAWIVSPKHGRSGICMVHFSSFGKLHVPALSFCTRKPRLLIKMLLLFSGISYEAQCMRKRQQSVLKHIPEIRRLKKLVFSNMGANRTKSRLVVTSGKGIRTVFLGKKSKARNGFSLPYNRSGYMINLIPRDLDIVLGIFLVIKLKRFVTNENIPIGCQTVKRTCFYSQINTAVLRLCHSFLSKWVAPIVECDPPLYRLPVNTLVSYAHLIT